MRRTLSVVLIAVGLGLAANVEASPMTWYLKDVTFPNAIAVGSFVFDDSSFDLSARLFGAYNDVQIDVIENGSGDVFHYSGIGISADPHEVTFVSGFRGFQFQFLGVLEFSNGVVPLDTVLTVETFSSPTSSFRFITGGSVTTQAPDSVPEPSSLFALTIGALAMFLVVRSRRKPAERVDASA